MADGGLALAEPVAEVGDVQLAVLGEVEEDPQPGLVAQELEDLGELADRLLGDLGHGVSTVCRWLGRLLQRSLRAMVDTSACRAA